MLPPMEREAKLAKIGYVAFVADIYGKGIRPNTPQAARAESGKFVKDRPLLLARAQAAFDQLRQSSMVDSNKLAAIGYCFGGAPALAFTDNTHPSNPVHGSKYDPLADRRSWQAMTDLLKKTL